MSCSQYGLLCIDTICAKLNDDDDEDYADVELS